MGIIESHAAKLMTAIQSCRSNRHFTKQVNLNFQMDIIRFYIKNKVFQQVIFYLITLGQP